MERLSPINRAGHRAESRERIKDLETVVDAHNELSRSRLRVSGLFMTLHEVMPHGHAAVRPNAESELPRYIAMMNDQFTVAANGDAEIGLPREPLG